MKMLSDLLIGHNWPFFVKLTKKINWLTQMSCIALMGIKRKVLIPTYQGKKVKMSAYGKQADIFSFINFRPLWPCLHLKKV